MRKSRVQRIWENAVVFYLGGELVDGLKNTDNISQLTHIVGGACGMVFGFTLRSRKR